MSRNLILAGNWKMNKGPAETKAFLTDLQKELKMYPPCHKEIQEEQLKILFFPAFVSLATARELKETNPQSFWDFGAQNCHWEESGAFTGEVSAEMLRQAGAHYVIIGHSERRHVFGEPDEYMQKKIKAALEQDITPILCVGETLSEHEEKQTFQVVERQLVSALKTFDADRVARDIIIAYEPVWAIGTGKTASDSDAQEVCKYLRDLLARNFNRNTADSVPILYGGSVKPANARGLMAQTDIDGALIGGASLKTDSFLDIVKACLGDS